MGNHKLQLNFQTGLADNHEDLSNAIWTEIASRIRRNQMMKIWAIRTVALLSVAGLVPAVWTLVSEISTSGFFGYASLIFSQGALATSLKELALVLVEALPVTSIIFCLALIFIFGNTIRILAGQKHYSPLNA